jgi:RNA polymerase sigma-70 factor (ECF subfamily)
MDSDEALFERLCGGDLAAFDRLYARHERPLFGFLRALLGDATEAEDALHEAFLGVLRARDERGEVRCFKAWLYGVARNLARNRVRARKRGERAIGAVPEDAAVGAPPVHAEQALLGHERAAALASAVARLPVGLAEVYRLRAAGLSYEDVAGTLEVPVGTVKSRMNELVRRLREEMAR